MAHCYTVRFKPDDKTWTLDQGIKLIPPNFKLEGSEMEPVPFAHLCVGCRDVGKIWKILGLRNDLKAPDDFTLDQAACYISQRGKPTLRPVLTSREEGQALVHLVNISQVTGSQYYLRPCMAMRFQAGQRKCTGCGVKLDHGFHPNKGETIEWLTHITVPTLSQLAIVFRDGMAAAIAEGTNPLGGETLLLLNPGASIRIATNYHNELDAIRLNWQDGELNVERYNDWEKIEEPQALRRCRLAVEQS